MVNVRSRFNLDINLLACTGNLLGQSHLSGTFIALCKTLWFVGARLMASASQTDVKMHFLCLDQALRDVTEQLYWTF